MSRLAAHRWRDCWKSAEVAALAIFVLIAGLTMSGVGGIAVAAIAGGLVFVIVGSVLRARPVRLPVSAISHRRHADAGFGMENGPFVPGDLPELLDALPSDISYWDCNLVNRFANRVYRDRRGVKFADLPGMNLRDVLGAADFARNQPHIEAVLRGECQRFVAENYGGDIGGDGGAPTYSQVDYLPNIVDGTVVGFYSQVADVTELMQTRLDLATALRVNEALIESLNDQFIVSVADPEGCIIEANRCLQDISGYSAEELFGKTYREINAATQDAAFFDDMWRTIAMGTAWRGEICNRAKDGALFWTHSVIVPIRATTGAIDRYVMISSDITGAKDTETKLVASNRFLDSAGRAADVGGWALDLPSGAVTWSEQTCRIFEVDVEHVPGQRHPVLRYSDSALEHGKQAIDAAINQGKSWDFEAPIVSGKGRLRWLRAVGAPEYRDGKIMRLVGAIQDITAAKAAAAVLADERQLMTSLLDTIPDLVFFKDRESRFLRVNASMARFFGFADPAEMIGRRGEELVSAADAAKVASAEQQVMSTGNPAPEMELQFFWPNRPPTWHRSVKMPLRNAVGDIIGTFGVSRDITAAKADEIKLRSVARFLERSEDIAKTGGWAFDLRTHEVTWSAQTYKLHQVTPDYRPTVHTAGRFFPGPARRAIKAALKACVAQGIGWDYELPFVTATGEALWVRAVGAAEYENGIIVRVNGAIQDITTRKQAEARSRATEALLARSERVARVGGWEYDVQTGATTWSAQTRAIYDVDFDFVPKMARLRPFYPDGSFALLESVIADALGTGVGWDIEIPFLNMKQQKLWINSVGTAEVEDGVVVRLTGTMQDITARHLAEQRLRSSEAFLETTGQIAGVGGWEIDLETQIVIWTAQTYRIYETDVIPPNYLTTLPNHPPAARALLLKAANAAIAHGESWDLELPFITHAGADRWVRLVGTAETRDGRPVRLIGTIQDITAQKNAEIDRQRTAAMLRTVLDLVTNVAIVGTQIGSGFTVINAGAEALFGYSSAEFLENDIAPKLFDPEDVQERAALLSARVGRTVEGEDVFTDASVLGISQEWHCRRKDGHRFMVALVVQSMLAEDGSIDGYVVAAHDVTEQKQYEASLRESTMRAEAANRAKSEFLANMSHEIRTPINTVIGLTYLLGRSDLDPDQRTLLGTVATASQSLLSVINNVLDLSKIEAGEMLIEHVAFAPVPLIEEIASVVMTTAAAKGIALTLDFAADLPPVLCGDVVHLRQILTNLLANAIKFTDRGCVTVHMRQRAATATATTLEIVVADTGIGMSAATRQRLFTPFAQGDSSITRRFGGTGLGLSIVKQLVTLMGGEISVDSTEGVGSAFTVTLDFALATPDALASEVEQQTVAEESGLDGMRILVVDDSPVNLEVARRILNLEGAHVELACNGLVALNRLTAGPQDFDIVLMDVQMPVLNGYDATRRIRQELGLLALPIIALTANALSSERVRAIDSGMNDFVVKPFIVADLVRSIQRLVPITRPIALAGQSRTRDLNGNQTIAGSTWPAIAGIDAEDVEGRLGGDVCLFKRLLGMFLADFADLSDLRTGNADELTQTAARLHRLRGSGGLLGATAIHVMASDGESASLAGDGTGTAAIIVRIEALIAALAVCAAPVLIVAPVPTATHPAATAPLDLTRLIDLLERQNLHAGGEFTAVTPHLRGRMAVAEFTRLQGDIDNLRFAAAVARLRSLAI